jgi:hypothetical protein
MLIPPRFSAVGLSNRLARDVPKIALKDVIRAARRVVSARIGWNSLNERQLLLLAGFLAISAQTRDADGPGAADTKTSKSGRQRRQVWSMIEFHDMQRSSGAIIHSFTD